MSYQTIISRCNGKVNSLLAPDGFQYRWDEDIDYVSQITTTIYRLRLMLPIAKLIDKDKDSDKVSYMGRVMKYMSDESK